MLRWSFNTSLPPQRTMNFSLATLARFRLELCAGILGPLALLTGPPAMAQTAPPSGAIPAGAHLPRSPVLKAPRLLGRVLSSSTAQPVAGARVTIFTPDLTFFREVRTGPNGRYSATQLPTGFFRVGVAALGLQYEETTVNILPGDNQFMVLLDLESETGRWDVIGNTLPEFLDATDTAVLRPDGYIMFCHDTQTPVLFHPVSGDKYLGSSSNSEQGCMNTSLLADGSVLFAGGQDGSNPGNFQDAIGWVKRFRPNDTWQSLGDMNAPTGRWYPGLARLNDGRLLLMGGGTAPSAVRTATCEIFDPGTQSWTNTGEMGSAVEFPPSALLYNGKVLRTWGSIPQLYDVGTGTWSDTGQFVNSNRGFPGHSDHSLLVLTDGRALIVGALDTIGAPMTEFYDPLTAQWSNGTSPSLTRFQSEIVYLPSGEVFVGGGDIGAQLAGTEPEVLGIVRRCDLFDPNSGSWRRVPDMAWFREYHAVSLLVPDGRVITTGGTLIKFQFGPTSADIEAYSPPYLFRGVRPEIALISPTSNSRGATLRMTVFPETQLTGAVLMGAQSTTHWLDGGNYRRLELDVSQVAGVAQLSLPTDPDLLPLGWYLLFGMVDDIPSEGVFVRVDS